MCNAFVCRSAGLGGGAIAGVVIGGLVAISVPILIIGKVLCPQPTASLHSAACCMAAEGDPDLSRASQPLIKPHPSGATVVDVFMCRVACRLAGMLTEDISRPSQPWQGANQLYNISDHPACYFSSRLQPSSLCGGGGTGIGRGAHLSLLWPNPLTQTRLLTRLLTPSWLKP